MLIHPINTVSVLLMKVFNIHELFSCVKKKRLKTEYYGQFHNFIAFS